ncbi:MAG: PUA domain-containing protein [Halobacteriales archaeon]|nr:PUA domain-containing protein [Halobacteriales archaeon]
MADAPTDRDLSLLRTVAAYQFGADADRALFPDDALTIERSTSGRPRQIKAGTDRLVTYTIEGRFSLGVAGGRRLHESLEPPAYRVVVGDESEPYVREGRNVFAKFVVDADPAIRTGDEVMIVHGAFDGELIGVGRAELSATAMADFETGMAVMVRSGIPAESE